MDTVKNEKTPESARDKKERKRFSPKKLLAITLAAGSVALPLAGCGDKAVSASPTPNPDKTELASPSPTATELSIDEQLAIQEKFESYAPAMEQYAAMDSDTFEELPMDERLPYSQYLLDSMVIYEGYDGLYGEDTKFHDYELTPVTVTPDNTGQEILDSSLYDVQRSFMLCGVNDDGSDGTAEGHKALSSVYTNVGKDKLVTNDYLDAKRLQEERDESIGLYDKQTEIDCSKLLTGKNKEGDKVEYKIVTFKNQDGKTIFDLFVYHEFTNYDGAEKAVWLLDSQVYKDKIDDILTYSTSGIKPSSP